MDDLRAGISSSSPSFLTLFDGALFYAAHTDLTGTELFRSDGTSGGANIVEVGASRYRDSRSGFDALRGTTKYHIVPRGPTSARHS